MNSMKTILLVDDEPDLLKVLADTLARTGYAVIPRTDAGSALAVLREGNGIDLVITDLVMPGMGGDELALAVRNIRPDLPVILLTGHGSVESYIKTRSNGVFEYINKPVQVNELRRVVQVAIGSSNR